MYSNLHINEKRFQARFEELAAIGATADGGVHRPALSEAHLRARAWFREQAEQAGLAVLIDGAGNHSALLQSGLSDAKTLLIGSHLDSVPNGGKFDGALGVLCALEVAQMIRQEGIPLAVNLEVIDFTDEEGVSVSLLGSRAATGKLSASDLQLPPAKKEAFEKGLKRAGLTRPGILSSQRDPTAIASYLEVHIEQGPRLAQSGIDIGIVTHITGIHWYQLRFIGRANHSGTTPLENRRDAALGASAFVLAARETVLRSFASCVVNVGNMHFEPGAFNVVPAAVEVSLEFRAQTNEQLAALKRTLTELAHEQAARFELELNVEPVEAIPPAPMSEIAQKAIQEAADRLGLAHTPLASGAGHDAQPFADLCPVGMIFVPSVDGFSHSPREFTSWRDCVNGANTLLHAVLGMAGTTRKG